MWKCIWKDKFPTSGSDFLWLYTTLGSFPEPHNLEGFTLALLQSAPLPEAETLQGKRDEPT